MPRIPKFKENQISTRVPVARVNKRMLGRTYEALRGFGGDVFEVAMDVAQKRKRRNDNISVNKALDDYTLASQNEFQKMENTYDANNQQVPSSGMDYADHYQDWNGGALESISENLPNDETREVFGNKVANLSRTNVLNADSQELGIKRKFMEKKDQEFVANNVRQIESFAFGRTDALEMFLKNNLTQRYGSYVADEFLNPTLADAKFRSDANKATYTVVDGEIDAGHIKDAMKALDVNQAILVDLGKAAGYDFSMMDANEAMGIPAIMSWTDPKTKRSIKMHQDIQIEGNKDSYLYKQLQPEEIVRLRKKLFTKMLQEQKKNIGAMNDMYTKNYNLNVSGDAAKYDPSRKGPTGDQLNTEFATKLSEFVGVIDDYKIGNMLSSTAAAHLIGIYKNRARGLSYQQQVELLNDLPNLLNEDSANASLIGVYGELFPKHIMDQVQTEMAKGGSAFRNAQQDFANFIVKNEQAYQKQKSQYTIDTNPDVERSYNKWVKSQDPKDFKDFVTQTRSSQMVRGTHYMDTVPIPEGVAIQWGKEFTHRLMQDKTGVAAEQYLREKMDSVQQNSNDNAVLDYLVEQEAVPAYAKYAFTFPTSAEGRERILRNNISRPFIIKSLPGKTSYDDMRQLSSTSLINLRGALLAHQFPANSNLYSMVVDQVALDASQRLGSMEAMKEPMFYGDPKPDQDQAIKDSVAELLNNHVYIPERNKKYNIIVPRKLFNDTSQGQSIESTEYIEPMMDGYKQHVLSHATFRIHPRVKADIVRMNPEFVGNEAAIQQRYREEMNRYGVIINAGADRVRLIDSRTGSPIIYSEMRDGRNVEVDGSMTFFDIRNLPGMNKLIRDEL